MYASIVSPMILAAEPTAKVPATKVAGEEDVSGLGHWAAELLPLADGGSLGH
jgi:hypothetical protein